MKQNVKNLLNLMKKKYEVNSLEALATKLNISLSGIEAWKRRDNIPFEYLLQMLKDTTVTGDEIIKNGIETANLIEYSQLYYFEETEKLKELGYETEKIEEVIIQKAKEINQELKKLRIQKESEQGN